MRVLHIFSTLEAVYEHLGCNTKVILVFNEETHQTKSLRRQKFENPPSKNGKVGALESG